METLAPSRAKAKANLTYRLVHECGMSWFAARSYDMSDLAMAPRVSVEAVGRSGRTGCR